MKKLYVVRLSQQERTELTKLINTGREAAYRRRHAQILLEADQGTYGSARHDREIVDKVGVARQTVERVRKRCVEGGLEAALGRRPRSRDRAPVLDGEGEAHLIAIACSEPPQGRARWTLHLLSDELKRRQVVQTISHETVRKVLKKTTSSRGVRKCGASHPSRTPPELVYTPKHGSWLNLAESEFSVLGRQRLSRRIGDLESLGEQVRVWTEHHNRTSRVVHWRFTTADARVKLHHLYPVIKG